MKKNHHIISFAIAGLALYLTFKNISYSQIKTAMFSIKYIYLVHATLLILFTFIIRAYRWKYLISPLKKVTAAQLFSPIMIGYMGNLLPARAGEFIRAFVVGKKLGIGFSSSLATIIVERIFDLLVLILLLVWILLFRAELFGHLEVYGTSLEGLITKFGWGSLGFCLFLILFCYLLVHSTENVLKFVSYIVSFLPEKWGAKCLELVRSFKNGLGVLTDYRTILIISVISLIEWLFIIISYYPFFTAFGIQDLPYTAVTMLVVMIGVFIALFPTPGYLGSFQLACVIALHKIYHVDEATAVSFGIISWVINMGVVSVFGTYYIFKEKISLAEMKTEKSDAL